MLGCSDNAFQSYPFRQSQRNKKCQKMFDNLKQLSSKSNLSDAQLRHKETSKILDFQYIYMYIYFKFPCMHTTAWLLYTFIIYTFNILLKLAVGTSNSLWYAILRYWSSVACDAMMSSLLRYWYWSINRATIKDLQLLWF